MCGLQHRPYCKQQSTTHGMLQTDQSICLLVASPHPQPPPSQGDVPPDGRSPATTSEVARPHHTPPLLLVRAIGAAPSSTLQSSPACRSSSLERLHVGSVLPNTSPPLDRLIRRDPTHQRRAPPTLSSSCHVDSNHNHCVVHLRSPFSARSRTVSNLPRGKG